MYDCGAGAEGRGSRIKGPSRVERVERVELPRETDVFLYGISGCKPSCGRG